MRVTERFKEILRYSSVLNALIVRNLKGQYRYSYLGFAWQFITPLIAVLLFYFLFTSLRENEMEDYWIYLCTGMFPFSFLNISISGGNTFISNAAMIKKIYFPREIYVLAKSISGLITFAISCAAIVMLTIFSGHDMNIAGLAFIIPMMFLSFLFVYGMDLLLSSIVVYIRDLGYLVSALSKIVFWGTPIFYTTDNLTGALADAIWINPFTWYITSFQDCIYYAESPEIITIVMCLIMALFIVMLGEFVFERLNRGFAERL